MLDSTSAPDGPRAAAADGTSSTATDTSGVTVAEAVPGGAVALPAGFALADADFARAGGDLVLTAPDGDRVVVRDFFAAEPSPALVLPEGASYPGALAARLAGSAAPAQLAQAAPGGGAEPIGQVDTVEGTVTVTRADGTTVRLGDGDPVFSGDVLVSGEDGAIGIVFADGTSFSMAENGRMVLDEMIYDPGAGDGRLALSVVKGVFTFVSGEIAKTDPEAMTIGTPVATIGIRGTQGGIDLADGQTLTVVLMPEASGYLGEIVVFTEAGARTLNLAEFAVTVTDITGMPSDPFHLTVGDVIQVFQRALGILPDRVGSVNDYGIGDDLAGLVGFETAGGQDDAPGAPPPLVVQYTDVDYTVQDDRIVIEQLLQLALDAVPDGGSGGGGGGDDDDIFPIPVPLTGQLVVGTDGDDTLIGGAGDDTLRGLGGDDLLRGGGGGDILDGGTGDDEVFGEAGDDIIIGGTGEGDDLLDGGPGTDTVVYTSTSLGIDVDLEAGFAFGPEIDGPGHMGDTLSGVENVIGGSGDDVLFGDDEANVLIGGAGKDEIFGRGGDDVLAGGDGDDFLLGGSGSNVLDGGAGIDTTALAGTFGEYAVDHLADRVVVIDGLAARDGANTIAGVEFLEFADLIDLGTDYTHADSWTMDDAFRNHYALTIAGNLDIDEIGSLTTFGTVAVDADLGLYDFAHLHNGGTFTVGDDMRVSGEATVENTSDLTLTVGDELHLSDKAVVTNAGTLTVADDVEFEDEAVLENSGAAAFAEDVRLEDEAHLQNDGTLSVGGSMRVSGEATVENTSDLTLTIGNDLDLSDGTALLNSGTVSVGGNTDVDDDAEWTNLSAGTVTAGSMRVLGDGEATNDGTLTVTGEDSLRVIEGGDLRNTGDITSENFIVVRDDTDGGFAIGSDLAALDNDADGTITTQGIGVRGFAQLFNKGTITIEDRGTSDHFDLNIFNEATGGTAEVINSGVLNVGQDIRMDIFGAAGGSTFTNTGEVTVGVILDIGKSGFGDTSVFDNQGSGTVTTEILQTSGVAEFTSSGTVEVGDDLNVRDESVVFNAGDLDILGDDITVEDDATLGNAGTTTIADGLFVRDDAHVDNLAGGTLNTFSVQLRDAATMLNAGTLAGARVNVNEGGTLTNTGTLTADQVVQVKDDGDGDPALGTVAATFYNAASGTVSAQQVQVRGFAIVTNDGSLTVEDRGGGVEQADLNVFNNATVIGGVPSTGIADVVNNGVVSVGDDINVNSFGDFGGSTFANSGIVSAAGNLTVGREDFAEVTLYDNMDFATTLANHVQVRGASHFENALGATATADEDFTVQHSATLNNIGVLNAGDQFRIQDAAVATNVGTINVATNVEMAGGTIANDGAVNAFGRINMSSGATVENRGTIDIDVNFNIDDDSTVTNFEGAEITTLDNINMHDDSVFTNADTVTVGAALRVEHNATFTNQVGATVGADSIEISEFGSFDNDGTVTTASDVNVRDDGSFSNVSLLTLTVGEDLNVEDDAAFDNAGVVTVAENMDVSDNAVWINQGTGTVNAGSMRIDDDGVFDNRGTLTIEGPDWLSVNESGRLVNSGNLNVNAVLAVKDDDDGDFVCDAGTPDATLHNTMDGEINAHEMQVRGFVDVVNDGAITIDNPSGDDDLSIFNDPTGGLATFTNNGTITVGEDLNHDSFGDVGGSTFTNTGDITIEATLGVGVDGLTGTTFTNAEGASVEAEDFNLEGGATFTNEAGAAIDIGDEVHVRNDGSLLNAGMMTVAGIMRVQDDSTVTNDGTLDVDTDLHVENGTLTNTSDTSLLVANELDVFGTGMLINTGTTVMENSLGADVNVNLFEIYESGSVVNEGTFTLGASFSIDGTTSFTNAGTFDVAGAFNMAGDDITFTVVLDGAGGGETSVVGNASFDGTLGIDLADGFTPTVGESFDLFTYESYSGAFDGITGTDLDGGLTLDVVFSDMAVTATVVGPGGTGTIDLGSLDGGNGFAMPGLDAGDSAGFAVGAAGDVNGDGLDDVLVTALGGDGPTEGTPSSGETYVVFGQASGWPASFDLDSLDGSNGSTVFGIDNGDASGTAVAGGDINGDGFADIIVGASNEDESYVIFGQETWPAAIGPAALTGANGFKVFLDNGMYTDVSGRALSTGDVNGDGFDDVIVGAWLGDGSGDGYADSGETYVVFGRADGFAPSVDLAELDGSDGVRFFVDTDHYNAGRSVSLVGDVNGDGMNDFVVGAPGADSDTGAAYVVFGRETWAAAVDLGALDGSDGLRIDGIAIQDSAGLSVSTAGDVNGDGFDDVVIGAPYRGGFYGRDGEAYVVFGGDSLGASIDLGALDGSNGFAVAPVGDYDTLGHAVGGGGDVNGDGFDDIIVGGPRIPYGYGDSAPGEAYVIFGKAAGFAASIELDGLAVSDGLTLLGITDDDRAGQAVGIAGDVNGDGYDDIIVGAPERGAYAGESYVVFGANFTGAVTHEGDDGDNVLAGTAGVDVMVGGRGNDRLTGDDGADVLRGGAGDDVFVDTSFARIDGGTGFDTLEHDGDLDLTALFTRITRITGIEAIDITGTGVNTLTLDLEELLAVTDGPNSFAGDIAHALVIDGDAGDVVDVDNPSDWTEDADSIIGYSIFTHNDANASLMVNDEVSFV